MGESEHSAREIVEHMMANDAFSQWLGIEVDAIEIGSCTLHMTVRQEMTNGFGIAHGGITFSLADSALAFACNSHGRRAVSVECDINHLHPVHTGDLLKAEAKETSCTNKIGVYHITITNQDAVQVAVFKGLVYRTSAHWEIS